MRIHHSLLAVAILLSMEALCAAQRPLAPAQNQSSAAPTQGDATPPQPPPLAAPAVPAASHILQPSLDTVQQTLGALKVDRWKRGSVRDEASDDINSIQQDMQQHMPGLLKDADATPGELSKALPLARHVDALYDVLLRVVEAARMAAPDDQANQLRDALSNLGKARLALDDSMETAAGSQEKQLVDLRVTVQKQAAFKCPAPPPPPECPKPALKKPVRRKPATTATPQTKAPATTAPGATPQKPPAGGAAQKPAAKPNTPTPNSPQQH